jgi:hypothetical protein
VNRVERALRAVTAALNDRGQPFALVGGFAISARSEPRFTRDVDLAVAVPDDPAAEALVHALAGAGYSVLATVEQEATNRLATVRLGVPGTMARAAVIVDLLFASSGIEPELVAAAEPLVVLPGLTLPVATTGHLIALKLLARSPDRPQDAADLLALASVATAPDWALARQAVMLIQRRGFHRGKDLARELDALTASK